MLEQAEHAAKRAELRDPGTDRPNGRKLVELTSTPPAPDSGPNPEIPATAAKVRTGGMVLTLLVVAIVFLMVVKPF